MREINERRKRRKNKGLKRTISRKRGRKEK